MFRYTTKHKQAVRLQVQFPDSEAQYLHFATFSILLYTNQPIIADTIQFIAYSVQFKYWSNPITNENVKQKTPQHIPLTDFVLFNIYSTFLKLLLMQVLKSELQNLHQHPSGLNRKDTETEYILYEKIAIYSSNNLAAYSTSIASKRFMVIHKPESHVWVSVQR